MKDNNKISSNQYSQIVSEVERQVKMMFDSISEEEFEKYFMDDEPEEDNTPHRGGRKQLRSTINPKYKANVRDAFARRNYDENWAKTVEPLNKFDQDELLQRYVYSLIFMDKECPQTIEEIDEIGIFSKYAQKFLNEGGTLEEIIELYNEQDRMTVQNRNGYARYIKSDINSIENNE